MLYKNTYVEEQADNAYDRLTCFTRIWQINLYKANGVSADNAVTKGSQKLNPVFAIGPINL